MNVDEGLPPDEQFASVLAAWDEALAAGATPRPAAGGSPELWSRLERGLACLQRLQGLRPRRPSVVPAANTPRPDIPTLADAELHHSLTDPATLDASAGTVNYAPEPGQRYTLTRLHATGGIGRVWLAYDSDLGREVALKELRPERSQNPGFADRFLHEAQITGQLEHPGIVPVYELTRRSEDHQPFYTMRFIKGRTLTDAIRAYHEKRAHGRAEPLEQVALLNAFVATCNAVAYAHSRGVIHRDVKGQNVVLGDFGEVVVLDWGFAKVLGRADDSAEAAPVVLAAEAGPGHTVQGQVIGTPAYMAPEQAEGRTDLIGRHTDVYGLGAILYELLTGRPPFAAAEVGELLRQVREAEPARPRQVWAGVPRALEAVCLRALAKEPAQRYPSAGELAREVQRWLADEPVATYREPLPARLGRWARRHQTLAAGLAVLLLSAVGGAVVIREEWARNEVRVQAAEKVADTERKARTEVATTAYLKHIALAQEALLAKQLARADELLERCEPGLRDWEWHYLQRRTNLCVNTLRGHTQVITRVVYRPDGRQLASASDDGTIQIWDATTGRPIRTIRGHQAQGIKPGGINWLAYRPPDGRYLASAGREDPSVRIWDATTGEQVFACLHQNSLVQGLAYSPDGRHLASGSWDKTVKVWDGDTGREIHTFPYAAEVRFVAYSPDGRYLAVALFDGSLRVVDADSGRGIRTLRGQAGPLSQVMFSADGQRLAATSGERTVILWNAASWEEVATLRGHTDIVHAPAFSPDSRRLASPSADESVRIWDATTGQPIRNLRGHRGWVHAVAFRPDGRQLASAGRDATVKIWDVTDLENNAGPEVLPLARQPGGIRGLAFSPDSGSLATAGQDGIVRLWNSATGHRPHPLLALSSPSPVVAVLVNVAVATTGPEILTIKGHGGTVASVVFSPDGKRLASAGEDGTVTVSDAATGREIYSLRVPAAPVRGVAFSADGQLLAMAGGDKSVTVWNAGNGQQLHRLQGAGDIIPSVAFSPNGQWLAAADAAGTLQLWDTTTGREVRTLHAQTSNALEDMFGVARQGREFRPARVRPRSASCVVISSDGKRLAWTSEDAIIKIWDLTALPTSLFRVPEAEVETVTLRGHTDLVTSLAFSPDGRRLVSAGEDKTVKLWDTKTGQEALSLRGHAGVMRGVAYSPDGRRLAAAGDDGTIMIWNGTPLDADPGR